MNIILTGWMQFVYQVKALEKQNEILRRRVAVAEQKKEEIRRKALFTQRKADVLLERFNMVTNDVERVQSRGPVAKVLFGDQPLEELTKAMRQLEVTHMQKKQEKAAERRKVVAEGEQQVQQLAVEKQHIQNLNVEFGVELAKGDCEIKVLEERLKQLKSAKEDLDKEDARINEVLKERELEIKSVSGAREGNQEEEGRGKGGRGDVE